MKPRGNRVLCGRTWWRSYQTHSKQQKRFVAESFVTCVKLMVKMACERLLTSFMPVLAVVRLMFPASISSSTSL